MQTVEIKDSSGNVVRVRSKDLGRGPAAFIARRNRKRLYPLAAYRASGLDKFGAPCEFGFSFGIVPGGYAQRISD